MAQSTGARTQAGLHHLMQQLTRRPAAEERATAEERDRVRMALEAFLRTFAEAKAGKAGASDLDRARLALLQALSGSLALATALPRLQAFLRAAAVELVAALSAGAATAAVFAVVPANAELDFKAAARLSGDRSVEMVPLREVQPLTGYVRGGVTVLGARKEYPVCVDETVELFEVISVSAGIRGTQILLAPADYLRATGAKTGALTR